MPLTDGRADIDFQILRQNESKREARGRGKGKEGGRERPSAVVAVCRPGSQRIKIDRLHWDGADGYRKACVSRVTRDRKTSTSSRSGFLPERMLVRRFVTNKFSKCATKMSNVIPGTRGRRKEMLWCTRADIYSAFVPSPSRVLSTRIRSVQCCIKSVSRQRSSALRLSFSRLRPSCENCRAISRNFQKYCLVIAVNHN